MVNMRKKNTQIFPVLLLFLIMVNGNTGAQQVTFTEVTSSAGLLMAVASRYSTNQAWGDFDNDGDLDVYVTSWGQSSTGEARNALFMNNSGVFTNVALSGSIAEDVGLMDNSVCGRWADYDNDGDLDLFVANFYEGDVVFRNNLIESGSATFTDVTSSIGFTNESVGRSNFASWGDYNNDGYPDLYVAKYWGKNALYMNNGGTSFSLQSEGDYSDVHDSEAAGWIDYDNDGDVDLYVVNREQENHLYENVNGILTLVKASDVEDTQIGRFGIWADYNNDGLMDLFLANIGANSLYKQDPAGTFSEVAGAAGVKSAPSAWDTWGAAFGDYDGDGDLDLFYSGGFDEYVWSDGFDGTFGNMLLEYNNGSFQDRTTNAGILRGILFGAQEYGSFSSSASFVDYDNDGDPDLMMTNTVQNVLYRNNNPTNNYVKVSLNDSRAGYNRNGLGAKVRVYNTSAPNTIIAMREIQSGTGPMLAHFGLSTLNTYNIEITLLKDGSGQRDVITLSNISVPLDTIIVR